MARVQPSKIGSRVSDHHHPTYLQPGIGDDRVGQPNGHETGAQLEPGDVKKLHRREFSFCHDDSHMNSAIFQLESKVRHGAVCM